MKTLLKSTLILIILAGCSESHTSYFGENQNKPATVSPAADKPCRVVLLGDKDGFGMGLPDGGAFSVAGGTSLPISHRSPDDAAFTDVYPADLGGTSSVPYQVLFTMVFDKPTGSISSAKFKLNTLGIQDGDGQVCGVDTDIKVFIDGQEIPNAFDNIDQFDIVNGAWSDIASRIELVIPTNLLYVLNDGKVEVKWNLIQLNPGSQSHDAFAIDYCELEICTIAW